MDELLERIEAQRRVIESQFDILVGLGFGVEELAAVSETSAPPAHNRGRLLALGVWLVPGPWFLGDHLHALIVLLS